MAKKDNWVRIRTVVIKAEERTARIPEDTQKCDLLQWTKGFLQEETAEIGDDVTVITAAGRRVTGTLVETGPHYTHDFGDFVPEIIEMERQLKGIELGGEA